MGYGAPRVAFNGNVKPVQSTAPVIKPKVDNSEEVVETVEKIEEETPVEMPTTFVKKSGPKGDVNKYTQKNTTKE